ncbi:MAG: diguanylate cyclase [Lachnospiraceae bacterium]|nr:diguanylate cyclase [Lachnospiraceae bacterium]
MRTIQSKITTLIVSIIIMAGILFFIVGYWNNAVLTKSDVNQILTLAAANTTHRYDDYFLTIEESVSTIHDYAVQKLDIFPDLTSQYNREPYTEDISALSLSVVQNIKGVTSVYYEYNPETIGPKTGFWIVYDPGTDDFVYAELSDFSIYDEDDDNYALWYYLPAEKKEAMWLGPYYDNDLDQSVYTYSYPVIYNDEVLGVIAMDINVDVLEDVAKSIDVYLDGTVFITDAEKNVLYSEHYQDGMSYENLSESEQNTLTSIKLQTVDVYTLNGITYNAYLTKLRSGMYLGVQIPAASLYDRQKSLFFMSSLVVLVCVLLSLVLGIHVVRTIVKPLADLTEAAESISAGNLDTTVVVSGDDEIGILAKALSKTMESLKSYIKLLDEKAKIDMLTGLNNKNAFQNTEEAINAELKQGADVFSVTVVDINDLKITNDTYGHETGDKLIVLVSNMIKQTYGERTSYRIGGDEFVAILRNSDMTDAKHHLAKLKAMMDEYNNSYTESPVLDHIYFAMGTTVYDPQTDKEFADVFNRADKLMYANKRELKGLL